MKAIPSASARHVVLRASEGERLPEALTRALREHQVACGWLRGSGVLAEVELRAFSTELGGQGPVRRVAGPVQVLALEGSIGISAGDVSVGLRSVIARETDRGLETLAGEIVSARVIALEALVTVLDDVVAPRALDAKAGVWLLGEPAASAAPAVPTAARPPETPQSWGDAIAASETTAEAPPQQKRPAPTTTGSNAMPQRIVRPVVQTDDSPPPEPGDVVEHFAFGLCDVLKSDGDRLHLQMHKDGRIKEIALEMLKVTPLPTGEDNRRRYKLDRRI